MSDLDLSLDDCLDLLGAGRNHKARLELEALRTAYATVQAERDAARADVQRLIEQNDETTREWGEDVTRLRADLATLRETLVGEVGAAVKSVPVRYDEAPEAWVRLHDIDRALAQLLRGAP